MHSQAKSVVMIGATGAVGGYTLETLLSIPEVERITLLGRRTIPTASKTSVNQLVIDIQHPASYKDYLTGHTTAICTLGVGQPSKVSKEDFVRIDKTAVLDFAALCKKAGVQHFELLGSVGASSKSSVFYLRVKGELEDELTQLNFDRLSLFQPSMILTPTNRYGFSQGVTLKLWPLLKPILLGGLRKYRGIRVQELGKAIALNILNEKSGEERLQWDEIKSLVE